MHHYPNPFISSGGRVSHLSREESLWRDKLTQLGGAPLLAKPRVGGKELNIATIRVLFSPQELEYRRTSGGVKAGGIGTKCPSESRAGVPTKTTGFRIEPSLLSNQSKL